MFCYQCEEAKDGQACTTAGVCGKDDLTANMQDLLIWLNKGLSYWAVMARTKGIEHHETDYFVARAAFSTITNVNFDLERIADLCRETLQRRAALQKDLADDAQGSHPACATWTPSDTATANLVVKAAQVGVNADADLNEDVRSLRELLVYGLKGLAAYTDHAYVLEHQDHKLLNFIQEGLVAAATLTEPDALVEMVLKTGEMGVGAMALLDTANTSTYGNPEPTPVSLDVEQGPGILISGHDLRDLAELLEQTEGTGVKVYTHGEMLPAQAYPAFKKYSHFAGNYGGAWFDQRDEFEKFNGPILMTTNCVVNPKSSYKNRLFTTGLVGWPDVTHIADRAEGKQKDFAKIIEMAKTCAAPSRLEEGQITVGFAHNAVAGVADKVVDAVKSGAIKRFVVMAGCDGRHKERAYYTDLAKALPQDHVILTAGCAKYRYNKLNLGDIGGIPRVLDAGQCNDSYSLVVTAQTLAKAFDVKDINDLPISYDIAWYEQKAVIVLLALLYLGVKHIRLGPTLPAFISPGVLKVLVDSFDIKPIGSVEADLAQIVAGQ